MAPKAADRSNHRQLQRRAAVGLLNDLANEFKAKRVPQKAGTEEVETLVRRLDRRCLDVGSSARLRAAIVLYTENGGALPVTLTPEPEEEVTHVSQLHLQRHRVLDEGFRLQAKAFMLTYNCKDFTAATWERFLAWVRGTARRLKASRWAACLEESQHAHPAAVPHACPSQPMLDRAKNPFTARK